MTPLILYSACVLGALGVYLVVRPGGAAGTNARRMRALGSIIGLGVFGYLVVGIGRAVAEAGDESALPEAFFAIFSLIAVAAAIRMITHGRPVYCALYFVLVVLSSAGLFLLLAAEFLAFALIIVYAGAILITYMFVLMLAQQSPDPRNPTNQPEYDVMPREPAAGAVVGFIMLALLSGMIVDGVPGLPAPPTPAEARANAWTKVLTAMPARVEEYAAPQVDGAFSLVLDAAGRPALTVIDGGNAAVVGVVDAGGVHHDVTLPEAALPENVQAVGYALISKFPVSLEVAGVILLLAMYGAVILARRQIELTEDEKREAAGMRRLGHHDDAPVGDAPDGVGNGGTA